MADPGRPSQGSEDGAEHRPGRGRGRGRAPGRPRRERRHPPAGPTASGGPAPELVDAPVAVGRPAHGGFVVARIGSVVTMVRHALPGELVRVAVTARRSRVWFADAVSVLERSADRVEHVWPEAGPGGVGGAELGHVAPEAQLDWKRTVLEDSLRRIGGEQVAADVEAADGATQVHAVEPGAGPGTRTRVELTGADDGRPGMHRHRSPEVVPLSAHPLADPRLGVPDLLADLRVDPGVRVRAVVGSGGDPDAGARVLVEGRPIAGTDRVAEEVPTMFGPVSHTLAATGFWQVHRSAPAALVETVLCLAAGLDPRLPGRHADEILPDAAAHTWGADADRAERVRGALDGTRVLELYAGAGLLSTALARAVGPTGHLLTLEGATSAVTDARANLADQDQARTLAGPVDPGTVRALGDEPQWARGGTVVLDPPRAGARGEVMAAVAALDPARIVHVACDPAALARDLAAARAAGYVAERVVALDLFEHTHHLEAVVSLVRA